MDDRLEGAGLKNELLVGPEGNNRSNSFHESILRHLPCAPKYFSRARTLQTYEIYTSEYLLLQLS